jgi:hypothetical protein
VAQRTLLLGKHRFAAVGRFRILPYRGLDSSRKQACQQQHLKKDHRSPPE